MSDDDSTKQTSDTQPNLAASASRDAIDKAGNQIKASGNPNAITGHQAGNPPEAPWFHRFMHSHFPDATPHDHWTLLFTAVIAFSTIVYSGASVWTLIEIRSGGVDTHNLAVAAAKQESHTEEIAQAAQDQVDAANEISDAAESFSETADTAVEEFRRAAAESAAASDKAARNAEITIKQAQDSFRADQRAWVGISNQVVARFSPADSLDAGIEFANSGKTPARKLQRTIGVTIHPLPLLDEPTAEDLKTLKFYGSGTLAPQARTALHTMATGDLISNLILKSNIAAHYDAVDKGTDIVYVFGEWKYVDVSDKDRSTKFCMYLVKVRDAPPEWKLSSCNGFNEMD